jgi:hypothetical protein
LLSLLSPLLTPFGMIVTVTGVYDLEHYRREYDRLSALQFQIDPAKLQGYPNKYG